jgi:S1-C subfamily serine protease
MADRPSADADRQHASYSPPPQHRPSWIDGGWVQQPSAARETQAQRRPAAPPPPVRANARRPRRTSTLLAVAIVAAMLASLGTYTLLLVTGQLGSRVVVSGPLGEQTGVNTQVDPDIVRVVEENAVTAAVDEVSPAVVTITPRGRDGIYTYESVGSGVIYDPDGWVVTNRHVVCRADTLTVRLADGSLYPGRIHGLDTLTDLAIIKIDAQGLPSVDLGNSGTLRVGQHAIAIGSPLGTFTNSVTTGVVSALGRTITVDDACRSGSQMDSLRNLIQTDAAINPGNSGGALVDAAGTLIGINTAIAGEAQGIGFAIPVNLARPIMQQAVEGEALSRPWMGIYYTPLSPALQDQRNLVLGYGALVEPPAEISAAAVFPGSPADEAGLRTGDIITHVDTIRVDGDNPLDEILTQYRPRETLTLRVLRGDELLELTLTLGDRPE